jgi:hypothetical protein
MKFYKIRFIYVGERKIKEEPYPDGLILKNFNKYFKEDDNIFYIYGFNKKDQMIYREYAGGKYRKLYINKDGLHFLSINEDGEYYIYNEKECEDWLQERKQIKLNKALKQILNKL